MNLPRWTPEKSGPLLSLGLGLAAFAAAYVSVSAELHPAMPAVTLASRASALMAFVLLPLTLAVVPLSGLRGLAPLALLRAPAAAALAGTALFHSVLALRGH